MMELTRQEQAALSVIGVAALAGLGVLLWQRATPPLTVAGISASAQSGPWDAALRASREVDVNTATAAQLERLPHVGPSLARRIVEYREAHGGFRTPEELSRVRGIGPKTLETLEEYITVE
jgi:competence protein ComEA